MIDLRVALSRGAPLRVHNNFPAEETALRAPATDPADLTATTITPSELTPSDVDAWRKLCLTQPQFSHPLLSPEFAVEVGKVRSDARVTIWRRGGRAVGFLAYHRRPFGPCRPIGAPFSDYHGLIGDGSFTAAEALTVAKIPAYRFDALVDPHGVFGESRIRQRQACAIKHDGAPQVLLEQLLLQHPKLIKNYRRLERKLERDVGPLRLTAPDRSPESFAKLLSWKRKQFSDTGAHDVLGPDWCRSLLDNLFEVGPGSRGLMICLYAGDQLAAGHFGVAAEGTYMPWITSVNPDFKAWSPGHLLLLHAIEALPDLQIHRYDLGATDSNYKEIYARPTFMIYEGLALSRSASGRTYRLAESVWSKLCGRSQALGRLRRRLRIISASEITLPGWLRGFAGSILRYRRRRGH